MKNLRAELNNLVDQVFLKEDARRVLELVYELFKKEVDEKV